MKRRRFLAAVGSASTVGIAGCAAGFPTGFLHGFLSDGVTTDQFISELEQTDYIATKEENIYVDEVLRAVQLKGTHRVLKSIVDSLPLDTYSLHKTTEYLPLTAENPTPTSGVSSTEGDSDHLQQLQTAGQSGSNMSVGLIDTAANWSSWYTKPDRLRQKQFSDPENPFIDPFRDEDHGELTAKTLFDTKTGLCVDASPHHAQISELVTTPQFFVSFCESLRWLAEYNTPIIIIPLSLNDPTESVLPRILNHYTTTVNQSIALVSAGNVDPCSDKSNALLQESNEYVIGVGSYTPENTEFAMRSGDESTTDLLGPDTHRISEQRVFSGTSASSAYIGGVSVLLWNKVRNNDPDLSRSEIQEIVKTTIVDTMPTINNPCAPSDELPVLQLSEL